MESQISSEKKLQLARKIREEHQMNRNILRGRESILYGRSSLGYGEVHSLENPNDEIERQEISTFGFRFVVAALLFFAFFLLDSRQESFLGISTESIYDMVGTDYSTEVFDFMKDIPETIHDISETEHMDQP